LIIVIVLTMLLKVLRSVCVITPDLGFNKL